MHRTKRGRILEFWVLLFVPVRPYRCGKCRLRFYGPKKLAPTLRAYDAFANNEKLSSEEQLHSEVPPEK